MRLFLLKPLSALIFKRFLIKNFYLFFYFFQRIYQNKMRCFSEVLRHDRSRDSLCQQYVIRCLRSTQHTSKLAHDGKVSCYRRSLSFVFYRHLSTQLMLESLDEKKKRICRLTHPFVGRSFFFSSQWEKVFKKNEKLIFTRIYQLEKERNSSVQRLGIPCHTNIIYVGLKSIIQLESYLLCYGFQRSHSINPITMFILLTMSYSAIVRTIDGDFRQRHSNIFVFTVALDNAITESQSMLDEYVQTNRDDCLCNTPLSMFHCENLHCFSYRMNIHRFCSSDGCSDSRAG